MDQWFEVDSGK